MHSINGETHAQKLPPDIQGTPYITLVTITIFNIEHSLITPRYKLRSRSRQGSSLEKVTVPLFLPNIILQLLTPHPLNDYTPYCNHLISLDTTLITQGQRQYIVQENDTSERFAKRQWHLTYADGEIKGQRFRGRMGRTKIWRNERREVCTGDCRRYCAVCGLCLRGSLLAGLIESS